MTVVGEPGARALGSLRAPAPPREAGARALPSEVGPPTARRSPLAGRE